jgi:microcystin degradation protein MlrC
MRIFAAGIATETNTFCPVPTGLDDFAVQRGSEVAAGRIEHASLDLSVTWGRLARASGAEFVFSLNAWAQPSGITLRSAYEALRTELLEDLRKAMPVDIVLLNLHGAMVAHGYDDCEEDMIRRVREIVGGQAVIGVELDLHCHLSVAKIEQADIVVTYKEYPHIDVHDRAEEVFALALEAKRGAIRPVKELFDCRMIGLYPTSRGPLRGLVDAMLQAERSDRILSISFGHGFQFADVPHLGSKILVLTDGDRPLAQATARQFGLLVYEMRRAIGFDALSLPLELALLKACISERVPVVVADQSDNAGAGAPSDSTFALRWLLERDVSSAAVAILYDPEAVSIAKKAGVGARLPMRLGGKMGRSSGEPLDLEVMVTALQANYVHTFPQQSGSPLLSPLGDVAALRCRGVDIIVSSKRSQCYDPSIFTDLGIDPRRRRLLVLKSTQHFYGAFAPIAGEVIYMTAPGAAPPDPRQIRYTRVDVSRLYPWTDDPLGSASANGQVG